MDYVPGETLDHINWNKYTQLKKYEICLQILRAVNNAHSNNVIHRDLKPSNIIYDKYADKVTLIDFGTSKKNSYGFRNYYAIIFRRLFCTRTYIG